MHGLPGSEEELRLAGAARRVLALPLSATDLPMPKARVIGFSLGAFRALRLAAEQPHSVRDLILISPAAPLDLAAVLPEMAGRSVFTLAQFPARFRAFSAAQTAAALVAPDWVLAQMLATATPEERALLALPHRRTILRHGLRHSLWTQHRTYVAEILAYVTPWADLLGRVQCPVAIIHGGADTWTPPAMASALSRALPKPPTITRLQEAGHYGTLIRVLEGEVAGVWA
ncbi:MAG: alpha/beta hydrolase [Pseudomonadota bacterium]